MHVPLVFSHLYFIFNLLVNTLSTIVSEIVVLVLQYLKWQYIVRLRVNHYSWKWFENRAHCLFMKQSHSLKKYLVEIMVKRFIFLIRIGQPS